MLYLKNLLMIFTLLTLTACQEYNKDRDVSLGNPLEGGSDIEPIQYSGLYSNKQPILDDLDLIEFFATINGAGGNESCCEIEEIISRSEAMKSHLQRVYNAPMHHQDLNELLEKLSLIHDILRIAPPLFAGPFCSSQGCQDGDSGNDDSGNDDSGNDDSGETEKREDCNSLHDCPGDF